MISYFHHIVLRACDISMVYDLMLTLISGLRECVCQISTLEVFPPPSILKGHLCPYLRSRKICSVSA